MREVICRSKWAERTDIGGAVEFSELAKSAASPFVRGYYQRVAERYLLLVADKFRLPEDDKLTAKQSGSARATGA